MKVRYEKPDLSLLELRERKYEAPTQTFLNDTTEYEVHAISVFDGMTFFLVADDLSTPQFYPRALFRVVETSIPADWICNAFPTGSVQLVVGPHFIAADQTAYDNMIDQCVVAVTKFWERLESRRADAKGRDDEDA